MNYINIININKFYNIFNTIKYFKRILLYVQLRAIRCWPVSLDNCIRQEKGHCRIQYKESSSSPPDPFQLDTQAPAASMTAAGGSYLDPTTSTPTSQQALKLIPKYSHDGSKFAAEPTSEPQKGTKGMPRGHKRRLCLIAISFHGL